MLHRYTLESSDTLSLFKEEPSILMRAIVFTLAAMCIMVLDARLHLLSGIRQGVSVVLIPLERVAQKPGQWLGSAYSYLGGVEQARVEEDAVRVRLVQQSLRAALVEELMLENQRLRAILGLRENTTLSGKAAQIIYALPDPYSQRVVVDRGRAHGIKEGAPVLDEHGVLGQVTRLLPFTSEVTLLTDQRFTVSVVNARTGVFGVAYGAPARASRHNMGSLELRFIPVSSDFQEGDLLITSGIDGVYPAGLPVARVVEVVQNPANVFATIWCEAVAGVHNARYAMLIDPAGELLKEAQALEEKKLNEADAENAAPRTDVVGAELVGIELPPSADEAAQTTEQVSTGGGGAQP